MRKGRQSNANLFRIFGGRIVQRTTLTAYYALMAKNLEIKAILESLPNLLMKRLIGIPNNAGS